MVDLPEPESPVNQMQTPRSATIASQPTDRGGHRYGGHRQGGHRYGGPPRGEPHPSKTESSMLISPASSASKRLSWYQSEKANCAFSAASAGSSGRVASSSFW